MVQFRKYIRRKNELFAGNDKAFLSPRLVLLQTGCDIQQALAVDSDGIAGDVVLAGIGKAVVVDDTDIIAIEHKLQRLIHMLHLIIVGMGLAVGSNQTVDAERTIVRLVAKVASIGILNIEY